MQTLNAPLRSKFRKISQVTTPDYQAWLILVAFEPFLEFGYICFRIVLFVIDFFIYSDVENYSDIKTEKKVYSLLKQEFQQLEKIACSRRKNCVWILKYRVNSLFWKLAVSNLEQFQQIFSLIQLSSLLNLKYFMWNEPFQKYIKLFAAR